MVSLRTGLLAMVAVLTVFVGTDATPASAQATALKRGSDNIQVLGHIPLGPTLSVSDMDLEQELSRPYAYVSRMRYGAAGPRGLDIISIENPERPERIYQWRIEDQELHLGTGAMDVKHFKVNGRYYVVQSLQFGQGGPDSDLGAVILDVNGLATSTIFTVLPTLYASKLPWGENAMLPIGSVFDSRNVATVPARAYQRIRSP